MTPVRRRRRRRHMRRSRRYTHTLGVRFRGGGGRPDAFPRTFASSTTVRLAVPRTGPSCSSPWVESRSASRARGPRCPLAHGRRGKQMKTRRNGSRRSRAPHTGRGRSENKIIITRVSRVQKKKQTRRRVVIIGVQELCAHSLTDGGGRTHCRRRGNNRSGAQTQSRPRRWPSPIPGRLHRDQVDQRCRRRRSEYFDGRPSTRTRSRARSFASYDVNVNLRRRVYRTLFIAVT